MPDVVPPGLLVPPDAHSRGLDRGEAAFVLDGYLRRLARQEARCRVVLGRLAGAFLARDGQHVLGFARIGDYARERLGVSGRELHSLASVVGRMDGLPLVTEAFEAGAITWAHVRVLAGRATPETERDWLTRARGRTVRALEALARQPDAEPEDDDIRFRLRCPRRVARLWGDVARLARRMAGAELTQGQAAEAVAAEGLSARPERGGSWPEPAVASWSLADPEENHAAFAPDLDWSAVAEAIPAEVEALADGAAELDPFALDARLRAAVRAMQRIDWQTGRLLRIFLDRRLHCLMGFSCASRYLRERLGLSERKARALVALERKTWQAPGLGEAYRAGALSWARALTILPVVTESSIPAWIARAGEVTVRRLADEVEWAVAARAALPPPPGTVLADPDRQMCARESWELADAEVAFTAPLSVVGLFRTAILAFAGPAEAPWRGFERLLAHVRAEWEAQPRHRDPIFARDGWRCAVPACSSRRNLHDHHLLYRSRGGKNARDNRITVCAWHHLRGIHAGRVRAWGCAPDVITWELGVAAGRKPLLRLHGDRYAHSPDG